MNRQIEENFVNTFIIEAKRTRILFELQSPKKRLRCVSRLQFWILPEFIHIVNSPRSIISKSEKIHNIRGDWYILATDGDDSCFLPFSEAFRNINNTFGFIYNSQSKIALYQGEYGEIFCLHNSESFNDLF